MVGFMRLIDGIPEFGGAAVCIAAVLAMAATGWAVWQRRRTRRILKSLDRMLDAAIRGAFTETLFDESLLSAVEVKLARYLAASGKVSQRAQAEKEQIKALIGNISHQIRTPIANVLLYTQLLEEQLPENTHTNIRILEQQALKLQALADALVKTSRLETGILVLHPQPGMLCPMLEEAMAQYAPRAAEKGITLSLLPTDVSAVFDPKWTAEAICNLLDNAIKYTPSGGAVTVQAIAYELFCRIDVADTGPGIPEAEQARVFQRFYRSAAARRTEGVGIGLYLARQIAEGQGGYIRVFSRPGKETRFSLYLPREH